MHFRTLDIFCSVAEQRSFSKAAATHQLTQSAVSQAMQQLEESLGVKLIDRSQRPLVLTAAGKVYLRGVRGVLKSYDRLEHEVRAVGRQLSGQITIGTIYSVGLSYLPEAREAFANLHPEVDVKIVFGSSQRVVEMTEQGEVDFGLVSFPKSSGQLQFVMWQQEPMRIVCSAGHRLANQNEVQLSQLAGIEMVGFDPELPLRQEIDQCLSKAGIKIRFSMEFDNADSMVRAIQASRGIGILPEAAVHRETASGALRVIACRELRMTRPLGIIYRRTGRLSQAASEFGSLLLGRPLDSERRGRGGAGGKATVEVSVDGKETSVLA